MRSKVTPARALYRLLSGQQQQQTSAASTSAANASARASLSSNTAVRSSRTAMLAARRRYESAGLASSPSLSAAVMGTTSSSNFTTPRRRRSIHGSSAALRRNMDRLRAGREHPLEHIVQRAAVAHLEAMADRAHNTPDGIVPVSPPRARPEEIAVSAFYAAHRPLLEREVVDERYKGHGRLINLFKSGMAKMEEQDGSSNDFGHILSAAVMNSLVEGGHMSKADMKNSTVILASTSDEDAPAVRKVEGIEQDRFTALIDRLAGLDSTEKNPREGVDLVKHEARKLTDEVARRKEIENAVGSALERGDDATTAQALGHEADLIILGEPAGPNASWAPGAATYLAQRTRAFEPPSSVEAAVHDDLASAMAEQENQMEHPFVANVKIMEEGDYDHNLLLSHAMVQAHLPPALSWDRLVAKMESASLQDSSKTGSLTMVDLNALNATLLQPIEAEEDEDAVNRVVDMDSVRRKRKKKMRKHKYKKLRKLTRVERSRLKK